MSEIDLVRTLFKDNNVPLGRDDVWEVQRTPVVKHRALERLADALSIRFDRPEILRHERDEAVLLVTGRRGEVVEWSIGEALVVPMVDTGRKNKWGKPEYEAPPGSTGNYQVTPKNSGYPYAMAEKRGKDRVIIKLAKLQGVYSEEEAEEFKERSPSDERTAPKSAMQDDGERLEAASTFINATEADNFRVLLANSGRSEEAFLGWAGIARLELLTKARLAEAQGLIAAGKKRRSSGADSNEGGRVAAE
jgi:hypothetical protein